MCRVGKCMQKIEKCYDQCVACTIWPIIFSGNVSSTQGLPLGFSNFSQPYWTNLINCDYTFHVPTKPTHNPRLASLKIEVSSKFLCPCTGKIFLGIFAFRQNAFQTLVAAASDQNSKCFDLIFQLGRLHQKFPRKSFSRTSALYGCSTTEKKC